MNHFLTIEELSSLQIQGLVKRALELKQNKQPPAYPQYNLANLFYEPSTRTRVSFELAARRLAMSVINLDIQTSSEIKGEQLLDTIKNLAAMGIQFFVIRHSLEGIQQELATQVGPEVRIVNAGDGTHAHPSQAILDIMTIMERKPRLNQLKIIVLGNIKHSRVAHSFETACAKLGVGELIQVAPKGWQPQKVAYGQVSDNLKESIKEADVVICLRVQQERLSEQDQIDTTWYRDHFALTETLLTQAKSDVLVMHPGPINRGVELDSEVADGPNSVILEQVKNGVYARMAILESLISSSI